MIHIKKQELEVIEHKHLLDTIRLYPELRELTVSKEDNKSKDTVLLNPAQTKIMEVFLRNPDKILSREDIISKAFDPERASKIKYPRTVDVYVCALNRIMRTEFELNHVITTVVGRGYILN